VTPIRPPLPGVPQAPGRADVARQAQKAFFEAALGRPVAAELQPQVAVPAPAPQASAKIPRPDQPAPTHILRPGSLLDIKV